MCMQGTLLGALRREKLSCFEIKKLEAEIEQMNLLVCLCYLSIYWLSSMLTKHLFVICQNLLIYSQFRTECNRRTFVYYGVM